jgi:hypothetical protein
MSEKNKIDQQQQPGPEERQAATEFPSVEEYCRQLDKQGIEYMIIPMQKLKTIDKNG